MGTFPSVTSLILRTILVDKNITDVHHTCFYAFFLSTERAALPVLLLAGRGYVLITSQWTKRGTGVCHCQAKHSTASGRLCSTLLWKSRGTLCVKMAGSNN